MTKLGRGMAGELGIVAIEVAEDMADGAQVSREWQEDAYPENTTEIETLRRNRGENRGFFRLIGRRLPGVMLQPYCWPDTLPSFPAQYVPQPLSRENEELK